VVRISQAFDDKRAPEQLELYPELEKCALRLLWFSELRSQKLNGCFKGSTTK
jgi:hypothetical protein